MREKNIVLLLEVVFILVVCVVITSFKSISSDISMDNTYYEDQSTPVELVTKL